MKRLEMQIPSIDSVQLLSAKIDIENNLVIAEYGTQEEFKRGDILAYGDILLIFDKYGASREDYYVFHSIWNNFSSCNRNWISGGFIHATDEQIAQLHKDLRKEGKKWNAKTLQVEDIKKEFKRGDIVIHDNTKRVSIFDSYENKYSRFNAIFSIGRSGDIGYNRSWNTDTLRYATSSEIEQFNNDLKEIGKKWNAETLQVEDLDINEIVYNLSSACSYLNKPTPDFKSLLLTISNKDFHKYKAQITLQLIREAWNKHDGFEVDYANSEQDKYFPVLDVYGDIKCLLSLCTTHISASCLSFPTQERALQFGKQFKELLKTAMGL